MPLSTLPADFDPLALALGRLTVPADGWRLPGGAMLCPAGAGMLMLLPAEPAAPTLDVLLSVGIHGNETAPVEVVCAIVADIAAGRLSLARRVLLQFGNPAALAVGERYLDYDLNRLFDGACHRHPASREAARAEELEHAARIFFAEPASARLHLDLHTAIRGSAFERFAIQPYTHEQPVSRLRLAWLAQAGIEAVLLHSAPASTYSYYTSRRLGADALTLELGKARPFGCNDLQRFAGMELALHDLLSGRSNGLAGAECPLPRLFRASYDIIKQTDAFRLHLAEDVENFTPLNAGQLLAEDGERRWVAQGGGERILFPNPAVRNGLRAGIVVVPAVLD